MVRGDDEAVRKMKNTEYAKFGGEEGYKAEMRRRGMKARKVGKGGFYNNPELARQAGKKSKRIDSAAKGEETR